MLKTVPAVCFIPMVNIILHIQSAIRKKYINDQKY